MINTNVPMKASKHHLRFAAILKDVLNDCVVFAGAGDDEPEGHVEEDARDRRPG